MDQLQLVTVEQPEHRVLRQKSKSVTLPLSNEDRTLVEAMKDKLLAIEGVGLAAPQVGVSKNITVIHIPEEIATLRQSVVEYPMHAIFNASYHGIEEDGFEADFEGCFSITDYMGKVKRFRTIDVTHQDADGNTHQRREHGFYARVLQHEIDHLHGILIIDRLTPNCPQGTVEAMKALRMAESNTGILTS